jgi:cobalamin-dependent methionine synthase I
MIAPALRRIGSEWSACNLSIGTEHRATAICERLIASRAQQPDGRPRGTAVTATLPGERHGLPAMMAAACLQEDRWHVHHLGADLPVADIIELTRATSGSLVVLSAATDDSARHAGQAADQVRRDLPGVNVLPGRPGATLRDLHGLARAAIG